MTRPPWVDGYKKGLASPTVKQVIVVDQFFPTPPALAARMVELANIREEHAVLEPSAGTGNIVRAIRPTGAGIVAIELNRQLADSIDNPSEFAHATFCGDFLSFDGTRLGWFDRIVMNPPFADGQDIAHIRHAKTLLAPGGRLVALCAAGPRQERMLRPLSSTWEIIEDAFKGVGTGVRVALLSMEAS